MSAGILHFDQSVFLPHRGLGRDVAVPSLMFLVEHPKGRVLFDTGLEPALASRPNEYWGETAAVTRPELSEHDTIVPQLASLGLSPDDIDYVVMSCLIYDHAGGMKHLGKSKFIVQRSELQEAWWPPPLLRNSYGHRYKENDLEPTRHFNFLDVEGEDVDIFGDESVVVLYAPCHARGEQALVVRLPVTGTVVLPAGVIPTLANLEDSVLPGRLAVDPYVANRSFNRVANLARQEDATILFHHDLEAWQRCRRAPSYYD